MKTRFTTLLATMITVFVALTSATNLLAQGTWTSIAPLPIGVGFGANGVAFGGQFYVFDGTDGISHAPQVYDPATDSWSVKAADPVLRSESSAAVFGNKIYVAEGWAGTFGSDSNVPTTALEIYDPATDSWTAGPSSLIARGLSASAMIDGKLYIAGGTAKHYQNFASLEIYDSLTNTWSKGPFLPHQLTSAAGVALNGKFYVLGGYIGARAYREQITAEVQIYDPALNTWSAGTPMPTPRADMVAGVINGNLFVASGVTINNAYDPSVLLYDPITDRWHAAANEPTPRAYPFAAVIGTQLFVAGGNTAEGPYTAAAEVFTPAQPGQ